MDRMLKLALVSTMVVVLIATVILLRFAVARESQLPPADRFEYHQLYFEIFKAIVVGFGIAVFGTLVPAVLAETRYKFERLRESRLAYSQAKTGAEYLPLRLASMNFKDAAAYIQKVHVQKHQAELYDELKLWLSRRRISDPQRNKPRRWSEDTYAKLNAGAIVLEENVDKWDRLTTGDRLRLLRSRTPR